MVDVVSTDEARGKTRRGAPNGVTRGEKETGSESDSSHPQEKPEAARPSLGAESVSVTRPFLTDRARPARRPGAMATSSQTAANNSMGVDPIMFVKTEKDTVKREASYRRLALYKRAPNGGYLFSSSQCGSLAADAATLAQHGVKELSVYTTAGAVVPSLGSICPEPSRLSLPSHMSTKMSQRSLSAAHSSPLAPAEFLDYGAYAAFGPVVDSTNATMAADETVWLGLQELDAVKSRDREGSTGNFSVQYERDLSIVGVSDEALLVQHARAVISCLNRSIATAASRPHKLDSEDAALKESLDELVCLLERSASYATAIEAKRLSKSVQEILKEQGVDQSTLELLDPSLYEQRRKEEKLQAAALERKKVLDAAEEVQGVNETADEEPSEGQPIDVASPETSDNSGDVDDTDQLDSEARDSEDVDVQAMPLDDGETKPTESQMEEEREEGEIVVHDPVDPALAFELGTKLIIALQEYQEQRFVTSAGGDIRPDELALAAKLRHLLSQLAAAVPPTVIAPVTSDLEKAMSEIRVPDSTYCGTIPPGKGPRLPPTFISPRVVYPKLAALQEHLRQSQPVVLPAHRGMPVPASAGTNGPGASNTESSGHRCANCGATQSTSWRPGASPDEKLCNRKSHLGVDYLGIDCY